MYTSLAPACLGNVWGRRKRRKRRREGRGGEGGGPYVWMMGVTRCGLPAPASPAGGEAVVHLMGHVLLGTGRALSREHGHQLHALNSIPHSH